MRVNGPAAAPPADAAAIHAQGAAFWPLALARELDDAMMHLRLNETEIGTWVLQSQGDAALVEAYDALLAKEAANWLVREIVLYWKRTLKRLDVSSRSLIALVEPGSCFAGTLFELVLAADRSYMLDGVFEGSNLPAATVRLTAMNFGPYPMGNGLTRLATRFLAEPKHVDELKDEIGEALDAEAADELGLVTFTPDDIDWEDEVRLVHRGARRLLARRADRHGGQPALRRAGDDGDQDLRPPVGLAELDLPAPQRHRPGGRAETLRHGQASQVRPQAGLRRQIMAIDYSQRIPNNVDLSSDRRLQRALENWQPRFLDWWKDMGPDGTLELRRLPAHRHLGRRQRLGQFRLREDAGLSLGHLPRRARIPTA